MATARVLDFAGNRSATLAQGTQLGRYLILGLIAEGGRGQVYLAHDTRFDRSVALKMLTPGVTVGPDRLARFADAVRATAQLSHPNIVALLDVGFHDGAPFIVSELLEGETLRARLKRGRLSAAVASRYAIDVARALAVAHRFGVVHHDLKPENLFITDDDRVKILDFGLAKCRDAVLGPIGGLRGTDVYLSPEQARGLPSDHRSDLFSLGVIVYEMVTGATPFRGDSAVEARYALLHGETPSIRSRFARVPPELERIIRDCLEKNPEMRVPWAQDLVSALESSLNTPRRSRRPVASIPFGPWKRGLSAFLRLM